MGHCGNSAADRGTMLSLRQQDQRDPNLWYPVATFILGDDGYLGEMKGRKNRKPIADYHQYIVPLLQHDMIEGIRGGGYMPANNFHINDLKDENQRNALIAAKPNLEGPETFSATYARTRNFAALNFSDIPHNLQPHSTELIKTETNYDGTVREYLEVQIDHIGSREDLIRKLSEHIPPLAQLDRLKDNIGDIKLNPSEPIYTQMDDTQLHQFYQTLSEPAQTWIRNELRIGTSFNKNNELLAIVTGLASGESQRISQTFDRAARFVFENSPANVTPEAIDSRIDKYLHYSYTMMRAPQGSIDLIDNQYWVVLGLDDYLNALDSYVEYQNDPGGEMGDDYWVLDVADHGWIGNDSGDSSNVVERLQEDDLITFDKPKDDRGYGQHNIENYRDSEFGQYGDGSQFDANSLDHQIIADLAKEFEQVLHGGRSKSGPQQDDATTDMFPDVPRAVRPDQQDESYSLARLRARAGIV